MKKILKVTRKFLAFLSKKQIKWGVIPLILILFWITFSVFLRPGSQFSIISYLQDKDTLQFSGSHTLLRSQKVNGEFKANENHLGIIWIRFIQPNFVNFEKEDTIVFRVKEKKSKDWYQVNSYKSGLIYGTSLFPFGFPPIKDSKDKIYQFQIESLNGNGENALTIDKRRLTILSSYQIPKNEIFESANTLSNFVLKKIIITFLNLDFLLYSTIYLLPLSYYILWFVVIKKIVLNKHFLRFITFAIIVFDILLITDTYTGVIFIALGFWIVFLIVNNYTSKISFIFGFILILVSVISTLINTNIITQKLSTWGYFMLGIGIIQDIWQLKQEYVINITKKIIKK
jgi:hypothetical protein